MGTSLTGVNISSSYLGLLKSTDSLAISTTAKRITDGAGNDLPIKLSTNQMLFNAGTVSAPALSFDGNLSEGFFLPTDENIGVAIAGSEVARFLSTGLSLTSSKLTLSNDQKVRWTSDDVYIQGTTASDNIQLGVGGSTQFTFAQTTGMRLHQYGSGNITGTVTQRLGVTSAGQVVEIPIGGGAVDGSGTAGKIVKWSDTDTITDSVISESSGNIQIQGLLGVGLVPESAVQLSVNGQIGASNNGNAGAPDFTFYGDDNTGMYRVGADSLGFTTGGTNALTFDSSQNSTFAGSITGTSASLTTSGTVLSLDRTGGATALIELKVGGTVEGYLGATTTKSLVVFNESASEKFSISNSGNATFAGDVTVQGGDILNASGNFTITSASDFKVDAVADIVLDADGGDVNLLDGGTSMGRLGLENGDLNIASTQQDYDIRLKGNDGGSVITALHLDMSEGGNATFAGDITLDDDLNFSTNGFADISNTGTGAMRFKPSSQTLALTLTGADATFAGNVTINKASNPTSLQIGSSLADDPFIVFQTDGNTMSMGIDRSDSNKFVISDNATLGTNNRLTIDTSGNSTFAGSVTVDALELDFNTSYYNQDKTISAFSASNYVYVNGTGGTDGLGLRLMSEGAGTNQIGLENLNDHIFFQTNSSERARIDSSGNLGLGTSSPTNGKLQIDSSTNQISIETGTAGDGRLHIGHFANGTFIGTYGDDGGVADLIRFGTHSGDERMRLTSVGAIGIDNSSPDSFNGSGTTSSSLVIGQGTSSISPQLTLWQGNSAQATINFASANTGAGQYEGRIRYTRDTGVMDFRTNGVANVLVLSSSGNVGIGSSPLRKLSVYQGDSSASFSQFINTTTGSTANDGLLVGIEADESAVFWNHENTPMIFATNNTERARIDSSGNLGLGTSSPSTLLHLYSSAPVLRLQDGGNWGSNATGGIEFYDQNSLMAVSEVVSNGDYNHNLIEAGNMKFLTTNTERMRISSAGGILMNTTTTGDGVLRIDFNDASSSPLNYGATITAGRTNSSVSIGFANPNGLVGSIQTLNSATSYNTSSDYRLKEDLQDFNALDIASKIKMYDFKWKVDDTRSYGVMAHELQEVFPQAVVGEKDAEEMQGVDYSKLVPILLKSIQELKSEIDELKKEI